MTVHTAVLDSKYLDFSGSTDASDTVQDALDRYDFTEIRGVGDLKWSNTVNLHTTKALTGVNKYLTRIRPDAGVIAIDIRADHEGARNATASFYDATLGQGMGTSIEQLGIFGVETQGQRGIQFTGGNDHVSLHEIALYDLDAGGLVLGEPFNDGGTIKSAVRECWFNNVTTKGCGDATNAGLRISMDSTTTGGDGSNLLSFVGCQVFAPRGVGLLISNPQSVEIMRQIMFTDFMLHGQITTVPNTGDLCVIEGEVTSVHFIGVKITGPGSTAGTSVLRTRVLNTVVPRHIVIQGSFTGGGAEGLIFDDVDGLRADLAIMGAGAAGFDVTFPANSLPAGSFAEVTLRNDQNGPVLTHSVDTSVREQVSLIVDGVEQASFRTSGTTAQRPVTPPYQGFRYYDTTLNVPIAWDTGATWRNGIGTAV